MSTGDLLSIAQVVEVTEAEGPGRRFAIWLQGCPLRCRDCCNPEMLSFDGGTPVSVEELLLRVQAVMSGERVEGLTLLGGEPFAHARSAGQFAKEAQRLGLSVMVFSGYTLAQLQRSPDPNVALLLRSTDILVDGPYLPERADNERRWIGSTNQQVHCLTDRYSSSDPCWADPDTLEIRLNEGELSINGFPAKSAVGLWERSASENF